MTLTGTLNGTALAFTENLTADLTALHFVTEGTVAYDSASNVATYTPEVNLSAATTYMAWIAGTVTSASGIQLGANYAWHFTTN